MKLGAEAIVAGIASGNINMSGIQTSTGLPLATMDLSETSNEAHQKHMLSVIALETHRRARLIAAPTDPETVKLALRENNEPITLFGENPADRRERLKVVLANQEIQKAIQVQGIVKVVESLSTSNGTSSLLTNTSSSSSSSVSMIGISDNTKSVLAPSLASSASTTATSTTTISSSSASYYTVNPTGQTVIGGNEITPTGQTEIIYSPALPELIQARYSIMQYSTARAQERLQQQQKVQQSSSTRHTSSTETNQYAIQEEYYAAKLYRNIKHMQANISQSADERPLTSCALLPGHQSSSSSSRTNPCTLLATGGWNTVIRLWNTQTTTNVANLKGHTERIVGITWHPQAHDSVVNNGNNYGVLVSGAADSTAKLWKIPHDIMDQYTHPSSSSAMMDTTMDQHGSSSLSSSSTSSQRYTEQGIKETLSFNGHMARLGGVAIHPSGNYIGTTSYDKTWRLWDITTGKEILLQDGHAKEVYPITFHPDGSLVATGDLSGLGRIWDLRSGQSIFKLRGHSKQCLTMDWAPNGYHIATGSDDNTCIIYELRQQRTLYTLPAHNNLVSRVRFAPRSGEYLVTTSFDNTIKLWNTRDWSLLHTFVGHEGKVTDIAILDDEEHFYSTGFDRTWKLWSSEKEF